MSSLVHIGSIFEKSWQKIHGLQSIFCTFATENKEYYEYDEVLSD